MGKYNLGEVWWTQFPFEDIIVNIRKAIRCINDIDIHCIVIL